MPWQAFTLEACIRATAANYSVYHGGVEALKEEIRTLRAKAAKWDEHVARVEAQRRDAMEGGRYDNLGSSGSDQG